MALYAYGTPSKAEHVKFVYDSLMDAEKPLSRFLYSWFSDCDLNRLKNVRWDDMDEDEKNCWYYGKRLLEFKEGDWIFHINVPEYGKVTAAKIVGHYIYQDKLPDGQDDGRHCFPVSDVFTFDRNDSRVHPKLSSRLKLQGSLYRLKNCEDEFKVSMNELKNKSSVVVAPKYHLMRETNEILDELTRIIHNNNPGKDFEIFLAEVFRKIPGVIDVKENGFGWGTDNGADLIVTYKAGLLPGLERERVLVIQAKSYEGGHWETNAVDQLRTAIDKYHASMGMLITTGERTETLEDAFKKLADDMDKINVDVHLLAGIEVAQFILQYGMNALLGTND